MVLFAHSTSACSNCPHVKMRNRLELGGATVVSVSLGHLANHRGPGSLSSRPVFPPTHSVWRLDMEIEGPLGYLLPGHSPWQVGCVLAWPSLCAQLCPNLPSHKDTGSIALGPPQSPRFTVLTLAKALSPNTASGPGAGIPVLGLPQADVGGPAWPLPWPPRLPCVLQGFLPGLSLTLRLCSVWVRVGSGPR